MGRCEMGQMRDLGSLAREPLPLNEKRKALHFSVSCKGILLGKRNYFVLF